MNPAFSSYPPTIRTKLEKLHVLILQAAAEAEEVGEVEQSLKWGQASYCPAKPRVGTAVRLGWRKSEPNTYALFFHCQTNLAGQFKRRFPGVFTYDGNRAIVFSVKDKIPVVKLKECIKMAFTYYLRK